MKFDEDLEKLSAEMGTSMRLWVLAIVSMMIGSSLLAEFRENNTVTELKDLMSYFYKQLGLTPTLTEKEMLQLLETARVKAIEMLQRSKTKKKQDPPPPTPPKKDPSKLN